MGTFSQDTRGTASATDWLIAVESEKVPGRHCFCPVRSPEISRGVACRANRDAARHAHLVFHRAVMYDMLARQPISMHPHPMHGETAKEAALSALARDSHAPD